MVPTYACDASQQADVEKLFSALDRNFGAPEVVIYNASYRIRGPFIDLDPVLCSRPDGAAWSNAPIHLFKRPTRNDGAPG